MKLHTKLGVVACLSVGVAAAACSSKNNTTPTAAATTAATSTSSAGGGTSSSSSTGGTGGMMVPAPPKLGAQIDRMGRPAINTVGSKTFDAANRDAAENAYNHDADPTHWQTHAADIAADLGVLDALDGKCGNSIAAAVNSALGTGKGPTDKGHYDALAGLLADDRLLLRTDGDGTCGLYLAVEANAIGVSQPLCGGRTPTDDVIRVSYSVLSGVFDPSKLAQGINAVFPFDDGIDVDPALTASFKAGFPFFAAAH